MMGTMVEATGEVAAAPTQRMLLPATNSAWPNIVLILTTSLINLK